MDSQAWRNLNCWEYIHLILELICIDILLFLFVVFVVLRLLQWFSSSTNSTSSFSLLLVFNSTVHYQVVGAFNARGAYIVCPGLTVHYLWFLFNLNWLLITLINLHSSKLPIYSISSRSIFSGSCINFDSNKLITIFIII